MNLLLILMSFITISAYSPLQNYGAETIKTVQCNGSVSLNGTTVTSHTEVNGNLKAEQSSLNSLQVNGQATLSHCIITNAAHINGGLTSDNTQFQSPLTVTSQKITLKECTLTSLHMKKVTGYTGPQIIDLRNGTHIEGPITVDSGNGEIWTSSDTQISENQVSGAVIQRK